MQWKNGRQLSQITTSNDTVTFKYNADGLRTRKDDSDYTTYYYYDDNKNLIAMMQGSAVAYYYYDSNNSVTAMSLNDTMYYYIKNLQGDITKIVNESGNVLVEYTYDAWGKILKETSSGNGTYANIKDFNPFRYRGYVYDTDTGLYYLQSRYYDPQTGRFLNADDTAFIGATGTALSGNIFAYCENDSVNNIDYSGNELISLSVLGIYMLVSLAVGLTAIAVVNTPEFKQGWSDLCNEIGTGSSNAFTFCYNNPIIYTDKNGYIAIADDILFLVLIGLCATVCILCGWMSTDQFKQSWQNFCNTIGSGLSSIWDEIWNESKSIWDWSVKKVKKATKVVIRYISAAIANNLVRGKLKQSRKNSNRFFTISFTSEDIPVLGAPISSKTAISRLKKGFSVITYFRSDAKYIANRTGGTKSICHQKHKKAFYFNHYHVKLKKIKHSIHSFYVIGG